MTTCVVIPPTVADDLVFSMLVQSVACGDDGLRELLEAEAQTIWCMTADCRADIHYLQAQLGVIDYAMLYARNQIDLANSRENSYGESVSTASSQSDTEGTRSSAYRKCGWSNATSWQQYERNSAQHDRERSDSVSTANAASEATSWDRGRQSAQGWAVSWDNALATSDATATTQARSSDVRDSQSSSGTPAWDGSGSIDTGHFDIEFTPPSFDIDFPPLSFTFDPGSFSIDDTIDNDYSNPGPHLPFCGDEDSPCEPLASMGRGWNVSYTVALSIVGISVSVTWGSGGNFRQSFICSSGRTSGTGIAWSESNATALDVSESDGASTAHDESLTQHDAHRRASSFSDADSAGSASARGIMRSRGETDSGADSAGHSEQSATGTSAQHGRSYSQSDSRSYDDSTGTSEARYWSQIFRSLQDMWARVLNEIKQAENLYHASAPALSGVLSATLARPCCDGRAPSYMTTRPRPVRVQMPARRVSSSICSVGMLQ